jgi:hypothetical protein
MTTERSRDSSTMAGAIAAMVARFDVADALTRLLATCASSYPAEAVAVLTKDARGGLELLSATSHRADELELLQIQSERGPCVDALTRNELVFATGEDVVERWGDVGRAILDAGYRGVHAYPMHWRGQTIGGLNLFVGNDGSPDEELGQMFADLATLAVLQARDVSTDQLVSRIQEAVSSRAVIEQAKGVLAQRNGTDLDRAYDDLLAEARGSGESLTTAAAEVVERQYRGGVPLPPRPAT